MIVMPGILECIEAVVGPDYKLSSLNARSTDPHNPEAQPWHVDAGAIADERGYWVCNTIWMLDDFTPDNGATRMIRVPTPGVGYPRPGTATHCRTSSSSPGVRVPSS